MSKKILILEDDETINFIYRESLPKAYQVEYRKQLKDLKSALAQKPDIIIADLKLPDGMFYEFLDKNPIKIPFLVVSGIDDIDTLRKLFSSGAADYIVKPFSKNELLLKIERALQKVSFPILDEKEICLRVSANKQIPLTQTEYKILYQFKNNSWNPVDREKLRTALWKDRNVSTKILDVHIHNMRKKLHNNGLRLTLSKDDKYELHMPQKEASSF